MGVFLILISSRQFCYRPPGAPFFLLRRRKNRGRKTPLRAGAPALRTHPLGGGRGRGWLCFNYQADLQVHPCPIPGEQTACRFACAYALRWGLDTFFQGCTLFRFNEKDFRDGSLQIRTLRRKRKRSGKRPAHQAGRRMQSQACLVPGTVCGCSPDAVPGVDP